MTRRTRRFSPRNAKPFSSLFIPPEREPFSTPWNDDTHAQPSLPTPGAQPGPQRDLADALGQFLQASDWLAGLRVLLSHPVLLTERVSKLLREGADAARRRGSVADEIVMLTHLVFLEDVRRRGFFVVHNELYDKSAGH